MHNCTHTHTHTRIYIHTHTYNYTPPLPLLQGNRQSAAAEAVLSVLYHGTEPKQHPAVPYSLFNTSLNPLQQTVGLCVFCFFLRKIDSRAARTSAFTHAYTRR